MSYSIRKLKTSEGKDIFQRSRDPTFSAGEIQWLRRDLFRRWSWTSAVDDCERQQTVVSTQSVASLVSEGFEPLGQDVYMLKNEKPKHSRADFFDNDDSNDSFTRATDLSAHTRRIHRAVSEWPTQVDRNTQGYRLWETIERINAREVKRRRCSASQDT